MDIKFENSISLKGFDIYKANSDTHSSLNGEKKMESTKDSNNLEKKDINKAVNELNKHLKKENTYAKYDVHDKLGDIMIKIIDNETKEVIMEFPPEKILDMVAKLCEEAGIVFSKKA